jgi:hypothetical protein
MGQKVGSAGMVLFGMVFLAIGMGVGGMTVRTLRQAEAMRSWTQTPATVLSCELQSHRGSKGGYTYRAVATYQYTAGGVSRTGTRVSLHSGSDNIGHFHERAYAELSRCRDAARPTVCWVNPQNPAEAILYPKPRLELMLLMQLFVLAFGGAGAAIVLAGAAGLLRRSDAEPEAGMGQIRMNGAGAHRVAGGVALAVNGYVAFFLWRAWTLMAPEPMPWFVWLLALAGAIPAAVAGYLIGRMRKYGVSVFEMSPLPGVLGGPVSGTIRIPSNVEAAAGIVVKLQCVRQYTTGSGKHRSTHRDVLWEEARTFDSGLAFGEETMLPVRFAVPYDKPATTAAGGSNGTYWRLTATAATPGIDYKAVFDVPVKHTKQSVPDSGAGAQPLPAEAAQVPVSAAVAREGLYLESRPDGGFELTFPPGRPRSAALFLTLFAIAWTGVCVALWTVLQVPRGIAFVFTAIDLMVIWALGHQLFVATGAVVDRARQELRVWTRFAGCARRERVFPFSSVTDIRSERAGQSGNTLIYRVVVVADGGTPLTVGSGLCLWNDAEDVAQLLQAGIRPVFDLASLRV